jgi:hypothetical protein
MIRNDCALPYDRPVAWQMAAYLNFLPGWDSK